MVEDDRYITKKTQDEIDQAREIENLKRVEAALFVSGRFISVQELVALTDLNPILLNQCLAKLAEKYNSNSAIQLVNKGALWKMDIHNDYRDIVNKLASGSEEFTKAEQETLAIVAYKQPITQSQIVKIRGNKAYDHIKKFVDLGLIRAKKTGRTKELNLSDDFYDYFNIKDEDLTIEKDEDLPVENSLGDSDNP